MPFPIKPMHELEEHNDIFEYRPDNAGSTLSSLQSMMLGDEMPIKQASKMKYSEDTLHLLEQIYESADEIVNAANKLTNPRQANSLYAVPKSISDGQLLALKTQGLIMGYGRSVELTDDGRVALRDKWLKEANNFKLNRPKDKFDIRTCSSNRKFKKIG